jgi:hypothetical protein
VDPGIIAQGLAAATLVKLVIDIARMAADLPRWVPPALAVVFGPLVVLLLMLSVGAALTTQTLASGALAGLFAAGAAVGVTEVSRRAEVRAQAMRAVRSRPPDAAS